MLSTKDCAATGKKLSADQTNPIQMLNEVIVNIEWFLVLKRIETKLVPRVHNQVRSNQCQECHNFALNYCCSRNYAFSHMRLDQQVLTLCILSNQTTQGNYEKSFWWFDKSLSKRTKVKDDNLRVSLWLELRELKKSHTSMLHSKKDDPNLGSRSIKKSGWLLIKWYRHLNASFDDTCGNQWILFRENYLPWWKQHWSKFYEENPIERIWTIMIDVSMM